MFGSCFRKLSESSKTKYSTLFFYCFSTPTPLCVKSSDYNAYGLYVSSPRKKEVEYHVLELSLNFRPHEPKSNHHLLKYKETFVCTPLTQTHTHIRLLREQIKEKSLRGVRVCSCYSKYIWMQKLYFKYLLPIN